MSGRSASFFVIAIALLLVGCAQVATRSPAAQSGRSDHAELQAIKVADQVDRKPGANIDWSVVGQRDRERLKRVRELVAAGELRTAVDFFNAALVCQHGSDLADIRLAHALATISATIDSTATSANWLSAASWDRLLMRMGKPQWYGTQFSRAKTAEARWELYAIDETAVSDEERKQLGVPTLAEARQRAEKLNQK